MKSMMTTTAFGPISSFYSSAKSATCAVHSAHISYTAGNLRAPRYESVTEKEAWLQHLLDQPRHFTPHTPRTRNHWAPRSCPNACRTEIATDRRQTAGSMGLRCPNQLTRGTRTGSA